MKWFWPSVRAAEIDNPRVAVGGGQGAHLIIKMNKDVPFIKASKINLSHGLFLEEHQPTLILSNPAFHRSPLPGLAACHRGKRAALGFKLSGSAFKYYSPSSVQGTGQPTVLSTLGNTLSFGSQGYNSVNSNRISWLIDGSTRGYSSPALEIIAIILYIHIPFWSLWRIFTSIIF